MHRTALLDELLAAALPAACCARHSLLLLPRTSVCHQAILDDDCVKVVLQFVVKLHAKKGSDLLSKFVHVITTAAYSHRSICDIQELGCHAHHVASIEVRIYSGAVSRGGCLKVCGVGSAGIAVLHRSSRLGTDCP